MVTERLLMERLTQRAPSEVEGAARQRPKTWFHQSTLPLHPQPDLDEDVGNFLGYRDKVTACTGALRVGGKVAPVKEAAMYVAL
jgi:hypothetical protein